MTGSSSWDDIHQVGTVLDSSSPRKLDDVDDKGLFINDVIIFGGYRDPPPPPRHHSSLFGYPPSHVRVTRDKTDFATKQRMLGS